MTNPSLARCRRVALLLNSSRATFVFQSVYTSPIKGWVTEQKERARCMSADSAIPPNAFIASFKAFMDEAVRQAPPEEEPIFRQRLWAHFDQEPTQLPVLSEQFKRADHPNLHLVLTDYLDAENRAFTLYGVSMANDHSGIHLVHLAQNETNHWAIPKDAPVEY